MKPSWNLGLAQPASSFPSPFFLFFMQPEEQIHMEELDAKEDLSYQEYRVKILETSERLTRNKRIKMCKVQWSHHTEEEATWEREEELKAEFPSFFSEPSKSQGQNSF
jgi:hypothetical protein